MKKWTSIKTRLWLIMMALILLQTAMLLISLFISNTFYKLNLNSFQIFENATENQLKASNEKIAEVIDIASGTDKKINKLISTTLDKNILNNEAYDNLILESSQLMIDMLSSNEISGAFVIFDDENPKIKELTSDKLSTTIHIRNSSYGDTSYPDDNMYLKSGSSIILKKLGIYGSNNWSHCKFKASDIKQNPVYKNPIETIINYPNSDITRYGYWNSSQDGKYFDSQFITYTLPIYDSHGDCYGVFGIEFFSDLISKKYFFTVKEPFEDSFFAVAKKKSPDLIDTSWLLSQSYKGKVALSNIDGIPLKTVYKNDIYKTKIGNLGNTNFNVNELKLYGDNSPFKDDKWYLIGFVSEKSLIENSIDVKVSLYGTIIASSIFSMILVLFFAEKFSKNISSLTDYLSEFKIGNTVKFEKTDITEIDELTGAIERLSYEIARSKNIISNILEMTLLPIGGFEQRFDVEVTSFTSYVSSLLRLDNENTSIRRLPNKEWNKYFNSLKANLYSKDESIYKYSTPDGKTVYLMINVKPRSDGIIGVIVDVTKQVNEKIRLTAMLKKDPLTGLYNKNGFIEKVNKNITSNPDSIGAVLFIDLDNLKYVNDTYGHEFGDKLIIEAGKYFNRLSKQGAIVSRISGDEFILFFNEFSNKEDIKEIIRKNLINKPVHYVNFPNGEELAIRFSTGISWYPSDSRNIKQLIRYSDYAMYESKKREKGTITEFNYEDYMKSKYISEKSETINELISNELIRFAFQPIVDIKNRKIYGYEALMRSKMDAFKSPMEILEVAKSQSKLRPLERLVFKQVFETIYEMRKVFSDQKFFINSIPIAMITPEELKKINSQYPIDIRNIVIEITEVEIDEEIEIKKNLAEFKNIGVKIAIDDFGKGYSGEVRILNTAPDIVKIDLDLIRNIHKNERKKALVKNLISYCKSTNTIVLAEGVEVEEELRVVKELGVDLVQGYYFAKPSFDFDEPLEEIIKKLESL